MSSLSSRPPSASSPSSVHGPPSASPPPFVHRPPSAFRTVASAASPPGPDVPHSAGADVPPTCEVPYFAPVRVRAGLLRPGRLAAHRRRAVAAGLAVTAAALVAAGPRETDESRDRPDESAAARPAAAAKTGDAVRKRRSGAYVAAPVRIADAATVRLLRPGDRVDVIAAEERPTGGETRVVARGARVTDIPDDPLHDADGADGAEGTGGADAVVGGVGSGALVVLSVPRATAAALVGASSMARLAVTLC